MRRLSVIILLLFVFSLAGAQDAPEPTAFMQMLARIPDTPALRESTPVVSYADYHAAILARGLEVPQDWAAFVSPEASVPAMTLPPTGPSTILRGLYVGGPEFETLLGFDFFDIAQAAEIGTPPGMGQILAGKFNPDSVSAAYLAREYTATDYVGGTLLCGPAGCEDGLRMDLRSRNPANPFGGALGRSELAWVSEQVFLNSPDAVLLTVLANAGTGPTLADAPEYQALAGVLAAYPYLSAVITVSPVALGALDVAAFDSAEAFEQVQADLAASPLPPYALAAFASASDDSAEYGLALLVYTDPDSAALAAASVDARMALISGRAKVPFAELFNQIGTLEPAQVVTDEATGLPVVVLRISGAIPGEGDDGRPVSSHLAFTRFLNGIYSRDTLWLTWGAPE